MAQITVKKLCTRYLLANVYSFERLEQAARREIGSAYATENWHEDDFLQEQPGKCEYSQQAVDDTGELVGFLIAAISAPGIVHIQRIVVDKRYRQGQLARKMLSETERAARQTRIKVIMAMVSPRNAELWQLFQQAGYRRLNQTKVVNGTRFHMVAKQL